MASAVGFSYAQAAKGRASAPSSSAVSGSATPSTEATPGSSNWAEDSESTDLTKTDGLVTEKAAQSGEAKSPASAASSVTSPDAGNSSTSTKDDDSSSVQNASESTWDSKSQTSEPTAKPTESEKSKDEPEASDETAKERKAAKPKLQPAPPPAVNIWQQRAQAAQVKTPAPAPARASAESNNSKREQRAEPRKKTGPAAGQAQEGKHASGRGERANSGRQATDASADGTKKAAASRQSPPVSAPAPTNEVAWPSMETAREEERKRALEKEEKADKEQAQLPATKPHGKREWAAVPINPTVIFETALPTRGAARGGRGGSGRGGAHASGRGAFSAERSAGRAQSLPNGDAPTKEQGEKTDREAMPPPPKPSRTGSEGQWRDAVPFEPRAQTADATNGHLSNGDAPVANGLAHEGEAAINGSAPHKRQSSTKRNKSPRKFEQRRSDDGSDRRPSVTSRAGDAPEQADGAKPSAERRSESRPLDAANPAPFREGKGKRGRGGHRGMNNAHFQSGHHGANGFPAPDFYGAFPGAPFSPRGGHFPQNARSGYRGSNARSQSIPIDNFGRAPGAYPAYPMQPMVPAFAPQQPDYYGNFPPAVPYQPGMEQIYLLPSISQQIEYYFSVDNLIKDLFFRKHMDSQGYVFLSFVADFKRLKTMTTDYDLIKFVCLQSTNIELRVGEDGQDRLRKVGDYERWVLPMSERDPSAQNDGPSRVERPAPPHLPIFDQPPFPRGPQSAGPFDRRFNEGPYAMNGMTPAFYPGGMETGTEELRGRQVKSPSREHDASPFEVDTNGEADTFPNEAIVTLTVVVRKSAQAPRAPYHTANSRTFSDGSIDSRSIFDEIKNPGDKVQTNGSSPVNGDATHRNQSPSTPGSNAVDDAAVQLFWVKDSEAPVESLPADIGHEHYTHLRQKALSQREVAATGNCPYDMDVLYQFWSHFLIRNFNAQMYAEFRQCAEDDAKARHNNVGMDNLMKYYSESLVSSIAIRDRVARDYVEYIKAENPKGERPALKQLKAAWRNGATNVKNRKKLSDLLDATPDAAAVKAEIET